MADAMVGVSCGVCGSDELQMITCDEVHGTGHPWAIASFCPDCLTSYVVDSELPCKSCPPGQGANAPREEGAGNAE